MTAGNAACIQHVRQAIDDTFPSTCRLLIAARAMWVGLSGVWMSRAQAHCGCRRSCVAAVFARSMRWWMSPTTYLLELGQPMHAFDLESCSGGIVVRMRQQGESLELLDGQTVDLRADTLVIADDSGPLAMAGIMGGQPSAVVLTTHESFSGVRIFYAAVAGR